MKFIVHVRQSNQILMNATREQTYVIQMQTVLIPTEVMSAYVTQDMKDLDLHARVSCVGTVNGTLISNYMCSLFTDVNECEEMNITCDQNAECMDIMGSYACVCNPGYTGNGIDNCCKLEGAVA